MTLPTDSAWAHVDVLCVGDREGRQVGPAGERKGCEMEVVGGLSSVGVMFPLSSPHHLSAELVGQLLLDLPHLARLAVIPQSPGHFLVGHFLPVALLHSPAVRQHLFVFGGELEGALVLVHPPDALLHLATPEQVQEELIKSDLLLDSYWGTRQGRDRFIES